MAAGHLDNFQTPAAALDPLVPYLRKEWVIWEPACGKGNLVRGLSDRGFQVFGTDILYGHDFLKCRRQRWGALVSNPPYSIKDKFLARCYELGKPFALLLPLTTFDSARRQRLFHEHGVQVLFMPRRISFDTPNGKGSSSWFATAWFCWGLDLPQQLTFSGFGDETGLKDAA